MQHVYIIIILLLVELSASVSNGVDYEPNRADLDNLDDYSGFVEDEETPENTTTTNEKGPVPNVHENDFSNSKFSCKIQY